jgi:hypothetical protein
MKNIIIAILFLLFVSSIECRFTTTYTTMRTPFLSNPTFYRPPMNTFQSRFTYSTGRIPGQSQYIPSYNPSVSSIKYDSSFRGSFWADRIQNERMNKNSHNNKARGKSLY